MADLLFTEEQIRELHNNDVYKRHTGFLKNMECSKNIIKDPNFSIEIDILHNGKPFKQLSALTRIFIILFMYFYVLKDFKRARDKVIAFVLDKRKDNSYNLSDYLNTEVRWLNLTSQTIEKLRIHIIQFVDDNDVKMTLYQIGNISKPEDKTLFQKSINERVNYFFDKYIDDLQKSERDEFFYQQKKLIQNRQSRQAINAYAQNSMSGNMTGNKTFELVSEEENCNE
jgi:hypothetical protein